MIQHNDSANPSGSRLGGPFAIIATDAVSPSRLLALIAGRLSAGSLQVSLHHDIDWRGCSTFVDGSALTDYLIGFLI
jgi:hypothetical protein